MNMNMNRNKRKHDQFLTDDASVDASLNESNNASISDKTTKEQ